MKKNEPFRFVAAIILHNQPSLMGETTVHKSERIGVQHIVEKVGATMQNVTQCARTLDEVAADAPGAKGTSIYRQRDPNLPVCYACVKAYKASPASQYARFAKSQ